jgi:hypothetical protein
MRVVLYIYKYCITREIQTQVEGSFDLYYIVAFPNLVDGCIMKYENNFFVVGLVITLLKRIVGLISDSLFFSKFKSDYNHKL